MLRAIGIVFGALLSAVILMAWGFVFWTYLPFTEMTVDYLLPEFAEEMALRLDLEGPNSGVFLYPPMPSPTASQAKQEAARAAHEAGPLMQIFASPRGVDPMSPEFLAVVFGHYFGMSLLGGLLLGSVASALTSYWRRVGFMLGVTLFAVVAINISLPIWFHQSWEYHVGLSGFYLVEGLLIGIVMGAFVRPPRAAQASKPAAPAAKAT